MKENLKQELDELDKKEFVQFVKTKLKTILAVKLGLNFTIIKFKNSEVD